MYTPLHFSQADPATLRAFMQTYNFAVLVSAGSAGAPQAVHLPLTWRERTRAGSAPEHGVLVGHVARANPIWRNFDGPQGAAGGAGVAGADALCIFSGPHTYISPRWYASRPQVPTWNYTAVHAYGRPQVIEDAAWSLALLTELAVLSERGLHPPGVEAWSVAEEQQYSEKLLPGMLAFELPIRRLEGKFKLNQNRAPADRAGVITALSASPDSNAQAIALLMRGMDEGVVDRCAEAGAPEAAD